MTGLVSQLSHVTQTQHSLQCKENVLPKWSRILTTLSVENKNNSEKQINNIKKGMNNKAKVTKTTFWQCSVCKRCLKYATDCNVIFNANKFARLFSWNICYFLLFFRQLSRSTDLFSTSRFSILISSSRYNFLLEGVFSIYWLGYILPVVSFDMEC